VTVRFISGLPSYHRQRETARLNKRSVLNRLSIRPLLLALCITRGIAWLQKHLLNAGRVPNRSWRKRNATSGIPAASSTLLKLGFCSQATSDEWKPT
jgi:hypothetical protein